VYLVVDTLYGPREEGRNGCRDALFFGALKHKRKTMATMMHVLLPIHHERPPHPERPPRCGSIYLISRLRGTFCGSAVVVGGSGDECGCFVVAAIYTV
jgi:hypothetical protein